MFINVNVSVFLLIFLAAVNCSKLCSKLSLAVVVSAEPRPWLRKVTIAFVIEMMPTFQTHGCETRKTMCCVHSALLLVLGDGQANTSIIHALRKPGHGILICFAKKEKNPECRLQTV